MRGFLIIVGRCNQGLIIDHRAALRGAVRLLNPSPSPSHQHLTNWQKQRADAAGFRLQHADLWKISTEDERGRKRSDVCTFYPYWMSKINAEFAWFSTQSDRHVIAVAFPHTEGNRFEGYRNALAWFFDILFWTLLILEASFSSFGAWLEIWWGGGRGGEIISDLGGTEFLFLKGFLVLDST